ncbi:MAG: hypothetical protein HZA16_08695, partial [Nitrospirae bacterium]|nr:hypothetical protein [Nitrospirota bacterium]
VWSGQHYPTNVGGTGYTATCGGSINQTNGTTTCNNSMGTYTPGGYY